MIGRAFILNGVPMTAVGVMPSRFTKQAADMYKPVALSRADPELANRFFLFQARLKPGVTLEQAAADLDIVAHGTSDWGPIPMQATGRRGVRWRPPPACDTTHSIRIPVLRGRCFLARAVH